jgi:hypothetical protein
MAAVGALADTPLAGALGRLREECNARFAGAQAMGRNVDAAVFRELLLTVVAPIAEAVQRTDAERVDAVVRVAYGISLELLASGLLGPRSLHPEIERGWRTLLPAAAPLLAMQPEATIATITNAIANLSAHPGAKPGRWIDEMTPIAAEVRDLATLRGAGHVIAWRCGMPRHRLRALDSCAALPPVLALRSLGLEEPIDAGQVPAILERLRADRWLTPAAALAPRVTTRELKILALAGGFRGFGGLFRTPPKVTVDTAGNLIAHDLEEFWSIVADAFGTSLERLAAKPVPGVSARFALRDGGTIAFDGRETKYEFLTLASSHAANADTFAATIDRSHDIFLFGLR